MVDMITKEKRLKDIFTRAKHDTKGNYSIYHSYRNMIEELNLNPKDFEAAVRKLSNILRV